MQNCIKVTIPVDKLTQAYTRPTSSACAPMHREIGLGLTFMWTFWCYYHHPCPVVSFLYFPCLISAVADWMSTILLHMAWP